MAETQLTRMEKLIGPIWRICYKFYILKSSIRRTENKNS